MVLIFLQHRPSGYVADDPTPASGLAPWAEWSYGGPSRILFQSEAGPSYPNLCPHINDTCLAKSWRKIASVLQCVHTTARQTGL